MTGTNWMPASGIPVTTLLLRHGQTPYSVAKRFAGRGDIGLTETGEVQAKAAARRLAAIDAIVSSPLTRARLTAEAVAQASGVEVVVDESFAEADFGSWDGLTFAEAQKQYPEHVEAWLADPGVAPPGGESFEQVRARVLAGLSRILPLGGTVVVVSHVTPIKILVAEALGAPLSALYRMHLDTACLNRIDWYSDGPAVVRSLNDTAHLQ